MLDKREYVRGNCICEAKIITDMETGENEVVSVIDLSASGLKFIEKGEEDNLKHKRGEVCRITLNFDDFNVSADIKIHRAAFDDADSAYVYGASFVNLDAEQKIRLDEFILYKENINLKKERKRNKGLGS